MADLQESYLHSILDAWKYGALVSQHHKLLEEYKGETCRRVHNIDSAFYAGQRQSASFWIVWTAWRETFLETRRGVEVGKVQRLADGRLNHLDLAISAEFRSVMLCLAMRFWRDAWARARQVQAAEKWNRADQQRLSHIEALSVSSLQGEMIRAIHSAWKMEAAVAKQERLMREQADRES
jgi:hypothetical protein